MWIAARDGDLAIARLLISHGALVDLWDGRGNGPLHVAASGGHLLVVKELLAAGASHRPNKGGETPLMKGVCAGDAAIVRELLENGAGVHGRTAWGWTALHMAAYNVSCMLQMTACEQTHKLQMTEIIALLLDAGADPNALDGCGATPLWLAAADGWVEGVRLLARRGGDVDGANINGAPPLIAALRLGRMEVVAELQRLGARSSQQ